jgi:hypothetical protein
LVSKAFDEFIIKLRITMRKLLIGFAFITHSCLEGIAGESAGCFFMGEPAFG